VHASVAGKRGAEFFGNQRNYFKNYTSHELLLDIFMQIIFEEFTRPFLFCHQTFVDLLELIMVLSLNQKLERREKLKIIYCEEIPLKIGLNFNKQR
jgi:hypothetical protein